MLPARAVSNQLLTADGHSIVRGHSSVGRALAWHARGRGFDSHWLHCHNSLLHKRLYSLQHPTERGSELIDGYGGAPSRRMLLWANLTHEIRPQSLGGKDLQGSTNGISRPCVLSSSLRKAGQLGWARVLWTCSESRPSSKCPFSRDHAAQDALGLQLCCNSSRTFGNSVAMMSSCRACVMISSTNVFLLASSATTSGVSS